MQIAIYADAGSQSFNRLHQAIILADVGRPPEVHSDIRLFCECFRSVAYHPDVIILMPTCFEELETLAAVRELFANSRTIIVLPERESSVISVGHLFHPSFITFEDEDFQDVVAILKHLGKHRQCRIDMHSQVWINEH
jgi:hypothetical protein